MKPLNNKTLRALNYFWYFYDFILFFNFQHDVDNDSDCSLSQAGLEEYSTTYYEQNPIVIMHQKQSSYAQSEGYHSYVSSSDSSSTPFLDRYVFLICV